MASPSPLIIGAGLAGLIAGVLSGRSHIFEREPAPRAVHRALLRFRTNLISNATGIPFRAVTVHKGIFSNGHSPSPSIHLANAYSQKVIGRLGERSIWNLAPEIRFVAPEDFYDQLLDLNTGRITWNTDAFANLATPVGSTISTAPLPVTLQAMGISTHNQEFHRAPIHVSRFRVPHADVFQTVYFPDPSTSIYRASITGDLLIVEAMEEVISGEMLSVLSAFNITHVDKIDSDIQHWGKIIPIDSTIRRSLIFQLSSQHRLFSLGRFATWRNILLDDLVQDYAIILNLIRSDLYTQAHNHAHSDDPS